MSPIGGTFVSNEIKAALEKLEMGISKSRTNSPIPPNSPPPAQRRSRARWSSLPVSLMKLATKKRASKSEDDNFLLPAHLERKETKEVVTLTEENLQRWEDEVGYVPKMYRLGYDLLKSPVDADMHVERATPVPIRTPPDAITLANAQGQMLTPPMSPPTSPPMSSGSPIAHYRPPPTPSMPAPTPGIRSSTTSTLIRAFPSVPGPRPEPALAVQKEALLTPNHLLITCALCGEVEHPSAFPAQPLSKDCLHAGRVCKDCVQHHVERCLDRKTSVRCPECGVGMGVEEVVKAVGQEMLRGMGRRGF